MKSGLFVAILLFAVLFLSLPEKIKADCYISYNQTTCGLLINQNTCTKDNTLYCCQVASECDTFVNPQCAAGVGVNTAIGCLIAGDPKQLISQLLGWGVAVGGGIAFLMIVLAGFQMATASGDPKKVQAARELLMSALAGLLIIVFSILLLNLIGFQILKLPGFNVNLL